MPTLLEIARAVGGYLAGPPDQQITGIASLEQAGPHDLAPVDSARFAEAARGSRAGALLVSRRLKAQWKTPAIVVDHALSALNRAIEMMGLVRRPPGGVHRTAVVEEGAEVHATAAIGPYAVVEAGAKVGARTVLGPHVVVESGVVLGEDCRVAAGVVLHEGVVAGDRVIIGSNSVLGGAGFGYTVGPKGPEQLHHVGRVVLEDDVHVGACCTIDRARFHETRLGRHTALDNMVHVGHNVTIGPRTFIAAQVGLAGSVRVGADCEIGGQVGMGDRCGVGDRCRVAGGTGVTRKFGDDLTLMWYPAFERNEAFRMIARLRKLAAREE
jgi:UDP-3-O-[3-hydroxymyristoyl] glucosamine N-acyltransferase